MNCSLWYVAPFYFCLGLYVYTLYVAALKHKMAA